MSNFVENAHKVHTDSYHHADHGDHNHHCDDDCDSGQPLVPGGLVHYGLARRGRPVRGRTVRPPEVQLVRQLVRQPLQCSGCRTSSFTTAWREDGAQSEGAQSDPPKCSGCRTSRARRERAAEWSRRERIAT